MGCYPISVIRRHSALALTLHLACWRANSLAALAPLHGVGRSWWAGAQQVPGRPDGFGRPGQHEQPAAVPLALGAGEAVDAFGAFGEELLRGRAQLPQRAPPVAFRGEPAVRRGAHQRLPAGFLLDAEPAEHVD